MRSNAVNQANSPPCIFPNVRKGFGRSFARFNTGLSMCFHRIVQNLFFRLLGHLNPIGKEGIFTVCLAAQYNGSLDTRYQSGEFETTLILRFPEHEKMP